MPFILVLSQGYQFLKTQVILIISSLDELK